MDSVRFGRVLGVGTRLAAKTVASAVDAAISPSPNAKPTNTPPTRAVREEPRVTNRIPDQAAAAAGRRAAEAARQAQATGRGLARGGGQFGQSVWGPFAKFSGVLWLELTGVFFGLFAVSGAVAAWRLHLQAIQMRGQGPASTHMLLSIFVAVLFGYFCVSSFVRARRRERDPR